MLVFCVTTTSGVTQKCVSEALLLNEPPFVYLLWKIHSLTWDNISLTFLLLSLFSSFLTATPRKFQELSPENVLVCRFKEWSRNGLQNTFFFFCDMQRDLTRSRLLTVILVHLKWSLEQHWAMLGTKHNSKLLP